jgi:hypothetical protein
MTESRCPSLPTGVDFGQSGGLRASGERRGVAWDGSPSLEY